MKSSVIMQTLVILAICVNLSGCLTLFEAFGGMPRAANEISIGPDTPTSKIFDCIENTIMNLHKKQNAWETKVTRRNEAKGIFETGRFSETNVGGFRVRATRVREESLLKLELKGAGPYYVDLGVVEGMQNLKAGIQTCL